MRFISKVKEAMGMKNDRERLPILMPIRCLGEKCVYFAETDCESRLELLEAIGKSGGTDISPYIDDSSYALYGQVCTGGVENIVVRLRADSPNGKADSMELYARMGRSENQRIVLTPRN